MYNGKKVVVVLPAYNAALTMEKTIAEVPMDIVDELVLVDDNSTDNSIEVAQTWESGILSGTQKTGVMEATKKVATTKRWS